MRLRGRPEARVALCFVLSSWSIPFTLGVRPESVLAADLAHRGSGVESLRLVSSRDHSRLQIQLPARAELQFSADALGFSLKVPHHTLADLGVPLGGESLWREEVSRQSDDHLARIEVKETDTGLEVLGRWKFPTGDAAPAHPGMVTFDYWEKNPSRFVVDFWPKSGPTVAEDRARLLHEKRVAAQEKAEAAAKARKSRRIASEQLRRQTEEVGGFCEQPISEESDIFLPFGPAHEEFPFGRYVAFSTPDSNYEYAQPQADGGKDARYFRVAHELYQQGKNALSVRALDFLRKEFPQSPLGPDAQFLRVNAMLKMGFQGEGERLLREVLSLFPNHPAAAQSALYLALNEMKRGATLPALEKFLWLSQNHEGHKLAWMFRMGAAEMMYRLKQSERASKEYQWVAENAPSARLRAEAAFRAGDIYLERFQYERALAAYFQALETHRPEAGKYPAVHLNRAESLYWLGQHDRAIGAFERFSEQFSGNPSGWKATLRLGEIYARRAGEKNQQEARKWFYATVNRYPFSPGATLARLRLLPCGDHGSFDLRAALRFFNGEAAKFEGGDGVILDRYRDLRALSRVRTLVTMGEDRLAVEAAIEELREGGTMEARKALGETLRRLFRKTILQLLDSGQPYEALAFYREKNERIPGPRSSSSDPAVESDYLLRLSRAASGLGLSSVSQELLERHQKHAGGSRALASEQENREKGDTEARLRVDEGAYSAALALWAQLRNRKELPDEQAGKLEQLLGQISDESSYSSEKYLMLGLLEQKRGKLASALKAALKGQLLQRRPHSEASVDSDRLRSWIAQLQSKAGDPRAALVELRSVDPNKDALSATEGETVASRIGLPPLLSLPERRVLEGELLGRLGRWGEAAKVFSLIEAGAGPKQDRYEQGRYEQARYEQARALRKTGKKADLKQAQQILKELAAGAKDEFWKRLAQDALGEGT